jgi:hypothetical protein
MRYHNLPELKVSSYKVEEKSVLMRMALEQAGYSRFLARLVADAYPFQNTEKCLVEVTERLGYHKWTALDAIRALLESPDLQNMGRSKGQQAQYSSYDFLFSDESDGPGPVEVDSNVLVNPESFREWWFLRTGRMIRNFTKEEWFEVLRLMVIAIEDCEEKRRREPCT